MLVRSEPAMIHRPSRRDIVKTTGLTAVGSLGLRYATRAQASTKLEPGTFSQIDSVLRAATSAAEVPGVVALAATENGILYEGIFGKRRLGEASAMTRDTVFRVASMVKAITSVAALQPVEHLRRADRGLDIRYRRVQRQLVLLDELQCSTASTPR